jgi:trans-aconitate 2-methyltransferase
MSFSHSRFNGYMAKPDWDVERYEARHQYVWNFGRGLVDWLAPQPGERILDAGCGAGQLTSEIAASGAHVTGLDSSPAMIAQARQNYPDITFVLDDVRTFALPDPFDAIFSNAVLHWVQPPEQAIQAFHRALKPGGRFVAEFGGKGNVQQVMEAVRAIHADFDFPWYYPSIAEYAALLEAHCFDVEQAHLFPRPTPLADADSAMDDWLRMFLPQLAPGARASVVERLRPALIRDGIWTVDYRRLRILARRR